MKIWISIVALLGFEGISAGMPLPPLYYGRDHAEFTLEFEGELEFAMSRTPSVEAAIHSQLKYLIGPMQYDPRFDRTYVPSAPRNDHQVSDIRIRRKEGTSSIWIATYKYTGTVAIRNADSASIPIRLPLRPTSFAQVGGRACIAPGESPARYWYYWSPLWEGCKLREGVDYRTYEGNLTPLKNTRRTYPEYERLWDENGVLEISIFFGIERPHGTHSPEKENVREKDPNAWSASQYRSTRNYLLLKSMGFEKISLMDGHRGDSFLLEKFEKKTQRGLIRVHMYYGETGFDKPRSGTFKTLYKDALENHSIVLYHGHSGYGSNLDLELLKEEVGPIELPKDRYQLIFLDGCSNYSYYAEMYRAANPSMDLITNGVKGLFSSSDNRNRVILGAIDLWANEGTALSYQEIIGRLRTSFLTGVHGDEDNPQPVTSAE